MQRGGTKLVLAAALLLVGAWFAADASSISTVTSTSQARRLFGGPAGELLCPGMAAENSNRLNLARWQLCGVSLRFKDATTLTETR